MMATRAEFATFVTLQLGGAQRGVTCRKMFGEYGLHCFGTFFALLCADTLYFKPTPSAEALLEQRGELVFEPAYEGSKDYLRIDALDDTEFLQALLTATMAELPPPKPKRPKKKITE